MVSLNFRAIVGLVARYAGTPSEIQREQSSWVSQWLYPFLAACVRETDDYVPQAGNRCKSQTFNLIPFRRHDYP